MMKYAVMTGGEPKTVTKVLNILDGKGYTWRSGRKLTGGERTFNPDYILVGLEDNKVFYCNDMDVLPCACEIISAELFVELSGYKRGKIEDGTPVMVKADYSQHGFKVGSVAIVIRDIGDGDIFAMGFSDLTKSVSEKYLSERDYEVLKR